jgi:hypothetical protein
MRKEHTGIIGFHQASDETEEPEDSEEENREEKREKAKKCWSFPNYGILSIINYTTCNALKDVFSLLTTGTRVIQYKPIDISSKKLQLNDIITKNEKNGSKFSSDLQEANVTI